MTLSLSGGCPRCGSRESVAASLDGGLTKIRQCVPCGHPYRPPDEALCVGCELPLDPDDGRAKVAVPLRNLLPLPVPTEGYAHFHEACCPPWVELP